MGVYKCPICEGRGTVDASFYLRSNESNVALHSHNAVTCKSCGGKGIVFDEINYSPKSTTRLDKNYLGYYTYGDYLREIGEIK